MGKRAREVNRMEQANKCIGCTVKQCRHHCKNQNYCSLDRISVGTHEANPTEAQCVDCNSFQLG
jgi:hypothetical protein